LTISLALVVRNEVTGCRIDLPNLPLAHFDEVYAIDGGSTDGTVEFLEAAGILVYRQPKPSLNYAYHHAVEKSKCDATVAFFPKGTIPPEQLLNFRPLLESGNGLVVASRMIQGAHNEEDDRIIRPRKWGVLALSLICSILWRREGNRIYDVLHGVKGFQNVAFCSMQVSEIGVTVDLEMVVRAYRKRIPRCEFPVTETARSHGASNFPIFRTGKKLIRFLIHEIRY